MYESVHDSNEDPSYKLLGMAFVAPVAGYVLITPANPTSKGAGQIFRALSTVLVSATILAVTTGSDWHVSHALIRTQYSAFSSRKVEGSLAVKIGLNGATIHLQGTVPDLPLTTVDFREKFTWSHVGDMKRHYNEALHKGLPFPMLTAAEYLSLDIDGFRWGRFYRQAGYYATFFLWCAFAFWLLANILWPVHTIYSAACLMSTGLLLLTSAFVYSINLPNRALVIPYEGKMLEFTYGWCYHATVLLGMVNVMFGMCIYLINCCGPSSQFHQESLSKPWQKHFGHYHNIKTEEITWQQ